MLMIEDLIENAKLIKKESFKLPSYSTYNLTDKLIRFYDSILRGYEEFSDFKITGLNNNN